MQGSLESLLANHFVIPGSLADQIFKNLGGYTDPSVTFLARRLFTLACLAEASSRIGCMEVSSAREQLSSQEHGKAFGDTPMLDGPGRLNVLAPTPPTTSRPVARRVRACVDGCRDGGAKGCRHGFKAYWDWRAARIAGPAVGMKAAACAQFLLSTQRDESVK